MSCSFYRIHAPSKYTKLDSFRKNLRRKHDDELSLAGEPQQAHQLDPCYDEQPQRDPLSESSDDSDKELEYHPVEVTCDVCYIRKQIQVFSSAMFLI